MAFELSGKVMRAEFAKRFVIQRGDREIRVRGSSVKLVMLCLADHANTSHNTWPTVRTVSHETCLDRKTILDALAVLVAWKLIRLTGFAKGKTRRVPVYRVQLDDLNGAGNGTITLAGNGSVSDANGPETGTGNGPDNGTQKLPTKQSKAGRTVREDAARLPERTKETIDAYDAAVLELREILR